MYAATVAWPIAPNWAIRARHIGGVGNDKIYYNGTFHQIVDGAIIGTSDLLLVRVDTPFTNYALMYDPLSDGESEIGKEVVMVGSSGSTKNPNAPITSNGTFMNGWNPTDLPASAAGKPNWGRNRVEAIYDDVIGSEVIATTFDKPTLDNGQPNPRYVGADEAAAYSGDSGGGSFIKQNGQWRLAGLVYAVDEVHATQTSLDSITGAVYDARNLWGDFYINDDPKQGRERRLITDANPVPLASYSTRIAAYRSQIDAITRQTAGLGTFTVPEAGAGQLMLGVGGLLLGATLIRRRRSVP